MAKSSVQFWIRDQPMRLRHRGRPHAVLVRIPSSQLVARPTSTVSFGLLVAELGLCASDLLRNSKNPLH